MAERPKDLSARLDAVRQRVRHLYLIHGVAQLAASFVVFVLATFLIDYSLPHLPPAVRITFLLVGLTGAAYGVWRFILYPLSIQITDDDIALCLERQYPKLRDRLISSIQLARGTREGDRFNSEELVQALIAETATLTDRLDFMAVVLPDVPNRRRRLAVFALAGLVLLGIVFPEYAGIYARRIVGMDVRWPRKTILVLEFPGNVVAKGEDFAVTARAKSGSTFPGKAYLLYRFASGIEDSQRMAKHPDFDAYRHELHRVMEDFSFSVVGGDDQTPWYDVKVVTPLRLERLQVYLQYPKYMRLTDTPADRPEEAGNLKVPIGTKVRVHAVANAPLSRAQLLLGRRDQAQSTDLALGRDPAGALTLASGEFTVTGDSEYSVVITGENDLASRNPPRYLIKAIVDNGPALKILEPTVEKMVTPNGTIPIRTHTKDDYGLFEIRMLWSLTNREKPEEVKVAFGAGQNDADYPAREIQSQTEIDLAAIKAREGDLITFRIEAEDTCEFPGHNITRSRPYTFAVVAKSVLEAQLDERRMKIKEELRAVHENQKKQAAEVEKMAEALGAKEELERQERRALATAAAAQQRHVAQRLERLVREMDEILKDVDNNKLWDVTSRDKVAAMRDTLKEDVEKKSPEASTLLSQASQSVSPANRTENLSKATAKQDEILSDLRQVLDQMEEWEDYMEVVKLVRELFDRQERMNEDIKRAGSRSK